MAVSKICYFYPYLGKIPILLFFSTGLKPPTRFLLGRFLIGRDKHVLFLIDVKFPEFF